MLDLSQIIYPVALACFAYSSWKIFFTSNVESPTVSKTFPGPAADPIIGHARIMPREYAWCTFAEWKKKFGDIIFVHVLGKPILILNSLDAARELLDKRGANYSDRPRFVLFQELMGWDSVLVFLRYGERFKKQRKLIQQHWNAQSVLTYRPMQIAETHTLLANFLSTPEIFERHIERAVSAGIMMAAYGHQVKSDNDPYVHLVEVATQMTVESGSPGASPVDFFPFLKYIPTWFPGSGFKRHALIARRAIQDMLDKPYEMVKMERAKGTARPSFLNSLLEEYEKFGETDLSYEEEMKAVGGVLYGAGVETTTASLTTFILAMLLNPSVAKKAQAEIDTVVGKERLPEFEDREHLPYIERIMRETYRWNPPLPLVIPHSSTKEDVYEGKVIPKGSMIIPNIWGIFRDAEAYPDPDTFDPDRYLGKHANLDKEADPASVVFGFGRRLCPGRFYADAGIWVALASVLTCFNILPALDDEGNEVLVAAEFTTGTSSQPKPFKCRISLRSPEYGRFIREAAVPSSTG